MTSLLLGALTLVVSGLLVVGPVVAADEEESGTELAKKTQNPVADLITVPFQSNVDFNSGSKNATIYTLNVQPVIPITLGEDWNLITRTIIPIINPTFFLSPRKPSKFIWGFGPTLTLPNQQWSVTGWGDKSVSQFLIQPFVNYNLGDGWYIVSARS